MTVTFEKNGKLHGSLVSRNTIVYLREIRTAYDQFQDPPAPSHCRGIFTAAQDLSRKLMRYIQTSSKPAHPFKWKCSNPENPPLLTNSLRWATRRKASA